MIRKRSASAALLLIIALLGLGCSRVTSDKQIATNIKARMFSNPRLRGSSLNVEVKDGVASLSGQVPSVAARYEAFKLTSETAGVKKVNDEMTIEDSVGSARVAAASPPASKSKNPIAKHRRATPRAKPVPTQSASSQMPLQTAPPKAEPEPAPASPAPAPTVDVVPVQPATPPPERITIPEGTRVHVRMIDSANSAVNHTGDILHASLAKPIKIGHQLVAPSGADVYLRLVEVRSAGHLGGQSKLRLELYRIQIQGRSFPLISNDYVDKGASRTKRTVLTILGGSAVGAAIGAIAGGGKGAAIGAAAGGGGGAIYQGATNAKQVDISPETLLKFKLAQPASVTLNPNASQPNPRP